MQVELGSEIVMRQDVFLVARSQVHRERTKESGTN
jgi:hypothetical protein